MVTIKQFEAFKTEAIAKQPIRKKILLSDLRFHTMDTVEYSGLMLGLNRSGLKGIIKIIGFSTSGTNGIESAVGETSAINILNALKDIISSTKQEVTIVVTPDRVITHVSLAKETSLISAETYFDTFERIANDHSLEIQSTHFDTKTGAISIKSLAGKHEFQVGSLSDEVFRTGLSFSRNIEGLKADPYMHRQVCTNGMVNRMFEESFSLRSMETRVWEEFYRHLDTIEKSEFVPKAFNSAVITSNSSAASLAELERGGDLILRNSNCEERDLEIFFKGMKNTYNRLHSAGIDTIKLTTQQKMNCRTGLSNWDVINGITDFASHNYGYEKKSGCDRHLQIQAGDMLANGPHTQNLIMNQPF